MQDLMDYGDADDESVEVVKPLLPTAMINVLSRIDSDEVGLLKRLELHDRLRDKIAVREDAAVLLSPTSSPPRERVYDSERLQNDETANNYLPIFLELPFFPIDKLSCLAEYTNLVNISNSTEESLNVSHKKLGDEYTYVIAGALSSNKYIRYVSLNDGRLTDKGMEAISRVLAKGEHQIHSLNISENSIRAKGIAALSDLLAASSSLLQLDMAKMNLTNVMIHYVEQGISFSYLQTLNLSKNELSDAAAIDLSRSLRKPCHLTHLNLSWNLIQATGAIALIEATQTSKRLYNLDLSWNCIGDSPKGQVLSTEASYPVAKALSLCFSQNQSLTHLDISQNRLTAEDCSIMAEGLKANHTLLGLHISGDEGRIDSYGFLVPDVEPWPLESGHNIMTRIIGGNVFDRERWTLRSACWICGRWRETKFTYTLTLDDIKLLAKDALADVAADVPVADIYNDAYLDEDAKAELRRQAEEDFFDKQVTAIKQRLRKIKLELSTCFDKWVPEQMKRVDEKLLVNSDYKNESLSSSTTQESNLVSGVSQAEDGAYAGHNGEGSEREATIIPETTKRDPVKEVLKRIVPPIFEIYRMVPPGRQYYAFAIDGGALVSNKRLPVSNSSTQDLIDSRAIIRPTLFRGAPCDVSQCGVLPDVLNVIDVAELTPAEALMGHHALFTKPRVVGFGDAYKKPWTITDSLFARTHVVQGDFVSQRMGFSTDWAVSKFSRIKDKAASTAIGEVARKHFVLLHEIFIHYCCCYSTDLFAMGFGAFTEVTTQCKIIESGSEDIVVQTQKSVIGDNAGKKISQKGQVSVAGASASASMKTTGNQSSNAPPNPRPPASEAPSRSRASTNQQQRQQKQHQVQSLTATAAEISNKNTSKKDRNKAASGMGFCRTEVDMIFVANCVSGPKTEKNTKRYLNRFQFMDSLIAIAKSKFGVKDVVESKRLAPASQSRTHTKTVKAHTITAAEAFDRLVMDHLIPFAERDDAANFHREYLLTAEVDTCLRKNLDVIKKVYAKYSGSENAPHEKRSMSPKEWASLFDAAGLLDDILHDRSIRLSYSKSKAFIVESFDDSDSMRKLKLLEFAEGLVRAAVFYAASAPMAASASRSEISISGAAEGEDGHIAVPNKQLAVAHSDSVAVIETRAVSLGSVVSSLERIIWRMKRLVNVIKSPRK